MRNSSVRIIRYIYFSTYNVMVVSMGRISSAHPPLLHHTPSPHHGQGFQLEEVPSLLPSPLKVAVDFPVVLPEKLFGPEPPLSRLFTANPRRL